MGVKEARKVLDEYFKETTIHGLGQIRLARKTQACLWLLITAAAALFSAVQLSLIVSRIRKREVIINIKVRCSTPIIYSTYARYSCTVLPC